MVGDDFVIEIKKRRSHGRPEDALPDGVNRAFLEEIVAPEQPDVLATALFKQQQSGFVKSPSRVQGKKTELRETVPESLYQLARTVCRPRIVDQKLDIRRKLRH
jgi:hypothetical protein